MTLCDYDYVFSYDFESIFIYVRVVLKQAIYMNIVINMMYLVSQLHNYTSIESPMNNSYINYAYLNFHD